MTALEKAEQAFADLGKKHRESKLFPMMRMTSLEIHAESARIVSTFTHKLLEGNL